MGTDRKDYEQYLKPFQEGNVWKVRFREMGENGKTVRRKKIIGSIKQYPTMKLASEAAAATRRQVNNTRVAGLFGDLCDKYLDSTKLPQGHASRQSYGSRVRRLKEAFGERRLDWMETPEGLEAIDKWLRNLKTLPTKNCAAEPMKLLSIRQLKATLHLLFELGMLWGSVPRGRNPLELVTIKEHEIEEGRLAKRVKLVLSLDEFIALLEDPKLDEHVKVMIQLSAMTGMRSSEFLGLRWEDIDFTRGVIQVWRSSVGKQQRNRTKTPGSAKLIPMHSDLADILEGWRGAQVPVEGWVFGSILTGRPFHRNGLLARHLKPAADRLGVEGLTWHSFRHTYRAQMRKLGIPLEDQKDLMRHSRLPTTTGYGNDDPTRVEELRTQNAKVVEMLRRRA